MLLQFSCQNFKTFKDRSVFNMTARNTLQALKDTVIHEKTGGKEASGVSCSVIYGANASGKTSIIHAMSFFRQIVLRGNILNMESDQTGDHVSYNMSLAPFAFNDVPKPMSFQILFTYNEVMYEYDLSFFVGGFMEETAERYITLERLLVNHSEVFRRDKEEVSFLNLRAIRKWLNADNVLDQQTIQKMMNANISHESLLLTTDFNSFCSKKVVNEILKYFRDQFIVINDADRVIYYPNAVNDGKVVVDNYINRIARAAGIFGSELAYVKDPGSSSAHLVSILNNQNSSERKGIDARMVESVGTIRLISIMPAVVIALKRGAALIVDEMDSSLGSPIIMNLISIFHDLDINKKGAQLIFNTQNPVYLDNRLLRRDEIKFVERKNDSKSSEIYSLADFRSNGEASVRNTTQYMKNYFRNRYGGIADADFTDIIQDILEATEDAE